MARANEVPISPVPTIAIVVKESSGNAASIGVNLPGNLSYTIQCLPETYGCRGT